MLEFNIQRNGRSLTMELPIDPGILDGELRNIGIYEPMQKIPQSEFTLKPLNEVGEHFMKLVQPEDSLWRIASYYNAPATLEHESRREMEALILADRFRSIDHIADYIDYGTDALDGLMRMDYSGQSVVMPAPLRVLYERFSTDRPMGEIRIAETGIQPVSELGKQLVMACQPYSDTIATINMACSLAWDVPDTIAAPAQIMESARTLQAPMPMEELRFYCPLMVQRRDPESGEYIELDNEYLAWHEEEVREVVQDMIGDVSMTDYLPKTLQGKIASVRWDIAKIGSEVYGETICELRVPLNADEQAELAGWIIGQNSDGALENLEEYPIETDSGDLYVSFWYHGDSYCLLPEDEFRAQVLELLIPKQEDNMKAPGQKPDCPLIGQDGNVFNLIGITARTLRENGLADQAKEMSERAFASGSYDQALGVIMEYVNPTSVDDGMDEDEDEDWCREPESDGEEWEESCMAQGFGGMGGMS